MEKYGLIFIVATSILCAPSLAEIESPLSLDKPFLIDRPHPTLVDIGELCLDTIGGVTEPNEHVPVWREIESQVNQKISEAGIKVTNTDEQGCAAVALFIPQLRVDIETVRFDDSTKCVFRVQTSLSRAVHLGKQNKDSFLFKADVWKTEPVIQAASVQDMPVVVSSVVLEQIEAFIIAWHDANLPNKAISDTNDIVASEIPLEVKGGPNVKTSAAEYKYVTSKNSEVFHRPDCRFARIISPDNLVGYSDRDEAISAGKRPCKTCKP
jgi:hypothetical protein